MHEPTEFGSAHVEPGRGDVLVVVGMGLEADSELTTSSITKHVRSNKRRKCQEADNLLDHDDLSVGGVEGLDLLRVLGSGRQRNHRPAD